MRGRAEDLDRAEARGVPSCLPLARAGLRAPALSASGCAGLRPHPCGSPACARRYQTCVHVDDIQPLYDVSGVQAYCINSRRAVLIHPKVWAGACCHTLHPAGRARPRLPAWLTNPARRCAVLCAERGEGAEVPRV